MVSAERKSALKRECEGQCEAAISTPTRTRGVRIDYAQAQENTPWECFVGKYSANKSGRNTPATDFAGQWLTPEGFDPKHVHNWIGLCLLKEAEQLISGSSIGSVNPRLRVLKQIEAAFLTSPEMSAEEYRGLLTRIDETERQLARTATKGSQGAGLKSGKGEANRATRRKPKPNKSKNGVRKREPAKKGKWPEKRERRKVQRKMVNGLGKLLDQLDICGSGGREEQMKNSQGTEGGLDESQVHESHDADGSGMDLS